MGWALALSEIIYTHWRFPYCWPESCGRNATVSDLTVASSLRFKDRSSLIAKGRPTPAPKSPLWSEYEGLGEWRRRSASRRFRSRLEHRRCAGRPRVGKVRRDARRKELWVANAQDQTISIADVIGTAVVATFPSTGAANRLKISPDGRYAFVSDLNGNEMLVVDIAARKEFKRIPLPGHSEGIVVAPDGRTVYTTLNDRDSVAAIDLGSMKMAGESKTGRGPDGLAWAARK